VGAKIALLSELGDSLLAQLLLGPRSGLHALVVPVQALRRPEESP
jgi:hypothetical protein